MRFGSSIRPIEGSPSFLGRRHRLEDRRVPCRPPLRRSNRDVVQSHISVGPVRGTLQGVSATHASPLSSLDNPA